MRGRKTGDAMATTKMTVQDELWLTMDRPNNLMVVDGVMILAGRADIDQVRDVHRRMLEHFPVFGRRAVRAGRSWAWEDDPHFDLDHHVRSVSLPEPADVATLQRFMSQQRSEPLDESRPRWLSYLVDNLILDDGSPGSALVTRFHHSIADGVRLTQVMLGMCDEPDMKISATPHAVATARPGSDPEATDSLGRAASLVRGGAHLAGRVARGTVDAARSPRRTLAAVPGNLARVAHDVEDAADEVGALTRRVGQAARIGIHGNSDSIGLLRHPNRLLDALEVLGIDGNRGMLDAATLTKIALAGEPHTIWSGHPGKEKAIAWSTPVPLPDIKAAGRSSGGTVNDVVLAAVAGGMRRYLTEHGGLVDEITWMVPVNVKPFEANLPPDLGNYFALVFLPMPLYDTECRDRLRHMHQLMERIKRSDEAVLTFGLQRIVSMSPQQVSVFLTNFFANKSVGVLSNVPGPREEMTFGGHPVLQVVGFAPCSGNNPMTATIFSYNDQVTVGFATDAGLVPDPNVMCDHVVAELHEIIDEFVAHRDQTPLP